MAQLAQFFAGLPPDRRDEARRAAEDAVAGLGPVLVDIQVLGAAARRRRISATSESLAVVTSSSGDSSTSPSSHDADQLRQAGHEDHALEVVARLRPRLVAEDLPGLGSHESGERAEQLVPAGAHQRIGVRLDDGDAHLVGRGDHEVDDGPDRRAHPVRGLSRRRGDRIQRRAGDLLADAVERGHEHVVTRPEALVEVALGEPGLGATAVMVVRASPVAASREMVASTSRARRAVTRSSALLPP